MKEGEGLRDWVHACMGVWTLILEPKFLQEIDPPAKNYWGCLSNANLVPCPCIKVKRLVEG